MISRRTRGIVLSVSDHGESDKLVTFFSPDIGRATGIAKGAKRSKQRFVNKLEPFSLLQIMYRSSRHGGLLFLREAELENSFFLLRRHYDCFVVAMFACELVLRFTREQDQDQAIFFLLLWALQILESGREPLQVAALFHLRLLGAAGYQPKLDRCGFCTKPVLSGRRYTLHPGSGLLVCDQCRSDMPKSMFSLSVQTLNFLRKAQFIDLSHLDRLRLPCRTADKTLLILYRYTRHLLQRDINSWRQVRGLRRTANESRPVAVPGATRTTRRSLAAIKNDVKTT